MNQFLETILFFSIFSQILSIILKKELLYIPFYGFIRMAIAGHIIIERRGRASSIFFNAKKKLRII